jgi:hypothetical protein
LPELLPQKTQILPNFLVGAAAAVSTMASATFLGVGTGRWGWGR